MTKAQKNVAANTAEVVEGTAVETVVAEQAQAEAPVDAPKKLYVQSVVGPLLDFETNKFIQEPAFHANTLYLKSQMAAGKIVLADQDA